MTMGRSITVCVKVTSGEQAMLTEIGGTPGKGARALIDANKAAWKAKGRDIEAEQVQAQIIEGNTP